MERNVVLDFINQNPRKYLNGMVGAKREIGGQKCIMSRDMSGRLIVSYAGQLLKFTWDRKTTLWC